MAVKMILTPLPGGGYVELPENYSGLELLAAVCVAIPEIEPPPEDGAMPEMRLRVVRNMIRQLVGPGAEISEEKLLIEKQITMSDLKPHQARLTLPVRSMREANFLTEEEERRLATRQGKNVGSLDHVPLVATCKNGEVVKSAVSLRRWVMPKPSGAVSVSYVLARSWTTILTMVPLQEGTHVQIWSARVDTRLWLALVRVPPV